MTDTCHPLSSKCNNYYDCGSTDSSDEEDCFALSPIDDPITDPKVVGTIYSRGMLYWQVGAQP